MKTDQLEEILKEEYQPPQEDNAPVKTKKIEKKYYSADFEGLCDLVLENEEVKFLMLDGTLLDNKVINDKVFLPPNREKLAYDIPSYNNIRHGVTGVTGVSDVMEDGHVSKQDKELFENIRVFHEESAELPDPRLYTLITAWDIHTHILEHFGHSPIIFFAGLPEKGKSRMAKSMIAVARRGLIKASVSDAQIIREASDHGATIFFDMTNFWLSIQKSGSEDVVLSRFERGLKVARVLNPEKGPFEDMTYFSVFGPTIIASNDTIEQVLGSRTVTVVMKQSKKNFKKLVDLKRGRELRDQLVAFRMRHFNSELPETEKIVSGRFGDIIKPLHQIVRFIRPDLEEEFIGLIKDLHKKRQENMSSTIEGELIQAIRSLSTEVINGMLAVKLITNKLNEEKSDKEKSTYQRVGRRLDVMGYQKARTSNGSSAIVWNEDTNLTLAIEHGVTDVEETYGAPETPKTSETPEAPEGQSIDIIGMTKDIFEI